MNDDQYIVGQFARITHMALPEDQWLVGRVGRIAGQSVINDEIASVLIAIDDTDEFVNAGDFEVLMVKTAYDQALEIIATLKESLRNIHLTASKSGNEPGAALAWIESETSRILKAIPTLLD